MQHFIPMGEPAGDSWDPEQHGEHLQREAHRLVDQPRIEVDIGVEPAADEVFIRQRYFLKLQRDIK